MFHNNKGKVVVVPNTVSKEKLVIDIFKIQETVKNVTEKDPHMQVDKVARKLRHEIKSSKSNMSWPLLTSQLSSENVSLRSLQRRFLNILLHDDGGRPLTTKVSSFAQDLLYAVIKGKYLPPKHKLLSFAIKLQTGNVELIKIINNLGLDVSYSKDSELNTAFTIQKLWQSTVIIPGQVDPHIPILSIYYNVDWSEETWSGVDATHRVNWIVIQKPFICPKEAPTHAVITKSKRRSINVALK